jgi:hypothetical protein
MIRRMMTVVPLAAALLAAGCGRDQREVVDEFQAHVSTGRGREAAALLDPNVTIIFDGTVYQGRAGAQRWLTEATQRRLGFPVGRLKGSRAGWQVTKGRVRGVRLIHGAGFPSGGPGEERISVQIDAEVRGGKITKITYELTPAAKAALGGGTERLSKIAAVFDGPPPMYNLGLFAANAVLEVGTTRITGSPAIAGWVLSNRPAATALAPTVQGSVVRWRGTFGSTATGAPRPARFEVDVAGAASAAPNIRRYTVIFDSDAAGQPTPAASQPASQPASAASQPASAASQPASAARPKPLP